MLLGKVYNTTATKKWQEKSSENRNLLPFDIRNDDSFFLTLIPRRWCGTLYCDVLLVRLLPETLMQLSSLIPPFLPHRWNGTSESGKRFSIFFTIVLSSTLSTIQMETFMVYIFVEMFAKYKYAPYSAHDIWKWFYFPIYSLSTWHSYDFCYVARSIAAVVSNSKGSQQEWRDEMIVK